MINHWSEHLPRINSLNLVLEISQEDEIKTMKLVSPDVLRVELSSGELDQFKLAYKVTSLHHRPQKSEVTPKGTQMIVTKLTTEDTPHMDEKFNLLMNDTVIWNKSDLKLLQPYNFKCSHCHKTLIQESQVQQLNDLPSESWAEMMDFWHCHKPSDDTKLGFQIRFNELKPRLNSIIIGNYYLMINKGDFGISEKCECGHQLGIEGKNATHRIFKWNLLLNDRNQYRPYYHAMNLLHDSINMNASRFFNLVDEETEEQSLVVWIFNFGLSVSSTTSDKIYDNCLKILYHKGSDPNFEKIVVPRIVLDDFEARLDKFNNGLPLVFKNVQQWKVSYLFL